MVTMFRCFCIVAALVANGCGSSSSPSPADDPSPTTLDLDTTLLALGSIAETVLPPALQVTSSFSGDPCAGVSGSDAMESFLRCQPILLKAYLRTATSHFSTLLEILDEDKNLIPDVNVTPEFTLRDGAVPYLHGMIGRDSSEFVLDRREIGDTDVESGTVRIVVNYLSTNQWKLEIFAAGIPCDANDTNGPERFRILIERDDSLWKGRAITYHPRSGALCASEPTDSSAMTIFTEFVGDLGFAKANTYMLARSVTDVTTLSSYELGKVCVNFPQYCGNSSDYVTQVALPYCAVEGELEPGWGDACGGSVGDSPFLARDWQSPFDFYQEARPVL